MYPFWNVIEPLLTAAEARTVIEVGADEGTNTLNLAKWAEGHHAVLHVIDPNPMFDVAALQRRFPEQLVMHLGLSLEVLPKLAEPDAILLDGDHNWYTLIEELRLLDRRATRWPLTFLHDLDWPYARRDMYYNPATVPEEYRWPYGQGGMVRGSSELSPQGLNAGFFNATHEGGPRNGVLTAIQDFIEETRRDVELFAVPGPAGLGILVDEERMSTRLGPLVRRVHDPEFAAKLPTPATPRARRVVRISRGEGGIRTRD